MLNTSHPLAFLFLGTVPYKEALALQHELHREICAGQRGPTVLLLEHPPILTLGKHGNRRNILTPAAEIVEIDRGGEVTAHMPGQLVAYPILPLGALGLTVKSYVHVLEETVIAFLANLGIAAARDAINPGVWVDNAKICAVGIRVKQRTTLHGIALNVCNAFDLFCGIIPCGIADRGVCSIATISGQQLTVRVAAQGFAQEFAGHLQRSYVWEELQS